MVGCLDDNARKMEAGELQRKLWQNLGYLKILWNAEPSENKFEELTEWITGVNNEVKQIIIVMTVFMRERVLQTTEPGQWAKNTRVIKVRILN